MIACDYNHWQPIAYHFIYFTSKHIISTLLQKRTQHICRNWNCSANSFRVDLTSTSFHGHRLPVLRAAKRHPQTSWRLWELSCCVQKKKQLVLLDFWAGTSCIFSHNSFPGSTRIAWLGLWIFMNFQDFSPSSHVCLRMIQDVRRLGIISGLSRREKSRISV